MPNLSIYQFIIYEFVPVSSTVHFTKKALNPTPASGSHGNCLTPVTGTLLSGVTVTVHPVAECVGVSVCVRVLAHS